MLTFLKGTLVAKVEESMKGAFFVVEVPGGMGFEVLSSRRSVASAPMAGESVTLFTSLVVREDAMFLVGFNSKEERDLFEILQNASGVGVKVALALLSTLSVSEIAQAVVSENYKPLTAAKGVGPKLAQKMVLDLREKMSSWRDTALAAVELQAEWGQFSQKSYVEAETVLLSLGYSREEVLRSFQALETAPSVNRDSSEEVLRESLRWLATV
jgi:Holliday junction DNA helicase RuvA